MTNTNGNGSKWRNVASTSSIVLVLLLQLVILTSWASRLATRQEYILLRLAKLEEKVDKGTDDRYRGKDAAKDFAKVDKTLDKMLAVIDSHELRLDKLELKYGLPK